MKSSCHIHFSKKVKTQVSKRFKDQSFIIYINYKEGQRKQNRIHIEGRDIVDNSSRWLVHKRNSQPNDQNLLISNLCFLYCQENWNKNKFKQSKSDLRKWVAHLLLLGLQNHLKLSLKQVHVTRIQILNSNLLHN